MMYSLQPNNLYARLEDGVIVEMNTPQPVGVFSFIEWGAAVAATDYTKAAPALVKEAFIITPPGLHHKIYDYIILLRWGEWLGVDF